MSRKRGSDDISDVVGDLVRAVRARPALTAAQKAARSARLRSIRAQERTAMIAAGLPIAQSRWANDSRPAWAKYRDMSVAGPYAQSISKYNPRRNDWPGVDDLGVAGAASTLYKLRAKKPYVMTAARAANAERLKAIAQARTAARVASMTPAEYAKYAKAKAKRDAKKAGMQLF